jgi:hypothetical protein
MSACLFHCKEAVQVNCLAAFVIEVWWCRFVDDPAQMTFCSFVTLPFRLLL